MNIIIIIIKIFIANIISQEITKGTIDINITIRICLAVLINYFINMTYNYLFYEESLIIYNNNNNNMNIDIFINYICLFISLLYVHMIYLDEFYKSIYHSFNFTNELISQKILYQILLKDYNIKKNMCKIISIIIINTIINIYKKKNILHNLSKKLIENIIIDNI
jgi:hypothetical protein